MESTEQFILSGNLSKSSKNEKMALNTVISGNKKLLPEDGITSTIDLYEKYLEERRNSNKFRLSININPFCTNVLFNPFTEIVKYETENVDGHKVPKNTFLNFSIISIDDEGEVEIKNLSDKNVYEDKAIGKDKPDYSYSAAEDCDDLRTLVPCDKRFVGNKYKWTAYDAIRDTQLSNERCGFKYYCGLDIFNNHVLRTKTFKPVNYTELSKKPIVSYRTVYGDDFDNPVQGNSANHIYVIPENFNTIDDYMRDKNGVIISDNVFVSNRYWTEAAPFEYPVPLHLYQRYDIMPFEDCIRARLVEKNGWFGFSNAATFDSLSLNNTDEDSPISSLEFSISPSFISQSSCGEDMDKQLTISLDEYTAKNQIGTSLGINKVINNASYCDFIDMYPTRELFSFTPLFNNTYKRYEKNWNYCLTYPSESIKVDFKGNKFPFFYYLPDKTIALRSVLFDEYVVDDKGRNLVTIYSIAQHGLKVGDNVNVYKGDELFYNNGKVVNVYDKYIFQIYKDSANISNMTINVDEIEWSANGRAEIDGIRIEKYENYIAYKGKYYPIAESNRCNIDEEAQVISFKRVVNDVECEYYVRKFSRLPNFKFADAEINDYNIYEDSELNLINKYSEPKDDKKLALYDFENHINSMSFAQTVYGDESTEILYTDDIDISYLKDNLGRPLSEIYFTILKNNKGYKKWYKNQISYNNETGHDDFEDIEFSHCFGYNSSSFLLNQNYRWFNDSTGFILKDVRDISAEKNYGLRYHEHNDEQDYFDDEMRFDEIKDYYGDICYYSPVECDEYVLQSVMGRFNTVQREISFYPEFNNSNIRDEYKRYSTYFNSYYDENIFCNGVLLHDEIIDNDDDVSLETQVISAFENFNYNDDVSNKFYHSSFNFNDKTNFYYNGMQSLREGYYYKMHYKIPLKTVSMSISSDAGINYEIFSIEATNNERLKIQTVSQNGLTLNDKLTLYNKTKNKFYYLTISEIFTEYYFECTVKNEDLSDGFKDEIDFVDEVSLVKRNLNTPEYARIIKDGSCKYYWREIMPNGVEQGDSKVYPFTNGAFYVNRQINFFLRRQDPYGENLGRTGKGQIKYSPDGEKLPDDYYDNIYYDSEEIETC